MNDTERTAEASNVLPLDPFDIREGLLTEDQIAGLRNRRKGKHVANFHRRQNDASKVVWVTSKANKNI